MARSPGTPRCRTASHAAPSMRRRRRTPLISPRARRFATGSSRRSRGTANRRLMQFVRRVLASPPPVAAAGLLVVLQLLAALALGHGQGWSYSHRDEVL